MTDPTNGGTGEPYELDIYQAAPGALPGLVKAFGDDIARIAAGGRTLVAAWTCEFGVLNRLLTLCRTSSTASPTAFEHRSHGQVSFHRRKLRAERAIFTHGAAHVVEFRTYSVLAGSRSPYLEKMLPALAIRERHSRNIGVWTPLGEDEDQVLHCWGYEDVADRMRARSAALADEDWRAYVTTVYPYLRRMESEILLPTTYSPLR